MTTQHPNPDWAGSTYKGFASPPAAARTESQPTGARKGLSRPWMLGGIAAAVAAGMGLGFAAQPRPVSAAKVEAAATPMAVELAPQPAPPIRSEGRLDVRPAVEALAESAPPAVPGGPRAAPLVAPRDRQPEAGPAGPALRERAGPPDEPDLYRPADVPDEPVFYDEVEDPDEAY